jgi:hypothetical protein
MRSSLPFVILLSCGASVAQILGTNELLEKLAKRPFEPALLGAVQASRDPALLPALRKAFDETSEKLTKQAISGTIVKLDREDVDHFEYLAEFAREAVRSQAPDVLGLDSKGHMVGGNISAAFETWCRDQGLDFKEEAGRQLYVYPSDLFELFGSGDPRAMEILRQGLLSRNHTIVQIAAHGVGQQQDVASIKLIVAAYRRFSIEDMAWSLAGALAEYDGEAIEKQIVGAIDDRYLREAYLKALEEKRKRKLTFPR